MLYSAHAPFGAFAFSAKPTHNQRFYESLRAGQGDAYSTDWDSIQQSRLYAAARCLGTAQYQLDRARNNQNPLKATELLALLEKDYGVIPVDGQTLPERQLAVAARKEVILGAAHDVIVDKLTELLGTDFVSYAVIGSPEFWPNVSSPPTLADISSFDRPGAQIKLMRITQSIPLTGLQAVTFESLGGTPGPHVGDIFCVEPTPFGRVEAVTVTAVDGGTFTADFTKGHDYGVKAMHPFPLWFSYQRMSIITVSTEAALDGATRQRIHDLMGRYARGVSTWQIQADAGGVFTSDDPILGLPDIIPTS